ncbi:MAG TPA: cob(I)yrinic acid a,c-diamide adenosyltransferase [Spirochaetia bacterium]|nr:cob(I)yrinic acid a,c-diamide adenosyltransferase [Spirochaetia bacterium]
MLDRGYIQVYTGNGKGKTTAAFGLSLRAAGAGLKVFICQFLKHGEYSELTAFERFSDLITVEQFGAQGFIIRGVRPEDRENGARGIARAHEVLSSGAYDVVVLDEFNLLLSLGVVSLSDGLALLEQKPSHVELILTGRNAPREIIEHADLVTEMVEVKHYYADGVPARRGIEK